MIGCYKMQHKDDIITWQISESKDHLGFRRKYSIAKFATIILICEGVQMRRKTMKTINLTPEMLQMGEEPILILTLTTFFSGKSKNVDYGRTWHLAKVPTMQVSNVWVMTGQRSKKCYQEAIRRRLRLSPIMTPLFHKVIKVNFSSFTLLFWDFIKSSVSADLLQVAMIKVIVRMEIKYLSDFFQCKRHLLSI